MSAHSIEFLILGIIIGAAWKLPFYLLLNILEWISPDTEVWPGDYGKRKK